MTTFYFEYVFCPLHPNDGFVCSRGTDLEAFECDVCQGTKYHSIDFNSSDDINLRPDLAIVPTEAILVYIEDELENANFHREINLVRNLFLQFAQGLNDKTAALKIASVFEAHVHGWD